MQAPLVACSLETLSIMGGTFFGSIFIDDAPHEIYEMVSGFIYLIYDDLCSMMGAFVCGVGYYTVLWGEIKDGEAQKSDHGKINGSSTSDQKVPLLQDKDDCEV